jgi:hypothetical protein
LYEIKAIALVIRYLSDLMLGKPLLSFLNFC